MLRKILVGLVLIALLAGAVAYWAYGIVFKSNTNFDKDSYNLFIPQGYGFDDVYAMIEKEGVIKDMASLRTTAKWMKYDKPKIASGKYLIQKGWNNRQIISTLRAGNQSPINLTFNNVRQITDLAGVLSSQLSYDSVSILDKMVDSKTLDQYGFDLQNALTMYIPNSYKVYWDISPEKLVARLHKEYKDFWSKNNRLEKAKTLNLTPSEVYTLASIVEKESLDPNERPTIAGLYLNRLSSGILLQADPTVVFATGIFDLRRVLNKHLEIDSPFNTYKYPGLPPGPIYMPSIQSIDAVLNPEKHDYLFMCAKPGYGSQHAFAKTLRGHNENADAYRKWLSAEGIK